MAEPQQKSQYETLAEGTEEFKEHLRVMLAAARAEGFNDEQAHDIVTGIFRGMGRTTPDA